MTTKLTLSVNTKIIIKAKKYARKKGTSVSKIFEDYIEDITNEGGDGKKSDPLESLRKLRGVAKGAIASDADYKDIIADSIMEKYL